MSIATKKMSSVDYRKIDRDSYSSLKMFVENRQKYWRKYILKEPVEMDKSPSLILGDVIDCLLFSPQEYENRFVESNTYELVKGKTHMGDFALNLWDLSEACLDGEGKMTREFADVAEEAYNNTKYDGNGVAVKFLKKTFEQVLGDFENSREEEWYKLRRMGKTVVNMQLKAQAERIIERLKTDDNTYELFCNTEDEIVDQMATEFDLFGLPFKGMPDRIFINHKKKIISPYDLKVTWDVRNFAWKYLDDKYYIQAGCYNDLLQYRYPEYTVKPMKFLVADSSNHYRPLIHELTETDVRNAINGFSIRGRKYPGIIEIIEELKWCRETNNWIIDKQDEENKGIRKLNIEYD